jgi:hypothetical protein
VVNTPSEAITHYRIPLTGPEAPLRAWQEANHNQVWSARHAVGAVPFSVLEVLPEGVVRLPERERTFHVVPAGRMHRVEHAFGFWRTIGADALYIKSPYENAFVYMMVVNAAADAYTTDTLTWTCPACGQLLRAVDIPTRRLRWNGLLDRALAEVRAFNEDAAARTCSACAAVHPYAYGFEPGDDRETERDARATW